MNFSPAQLSLEDIVIRITALGGLLSVLLLSGSAMIASAPFIADEDTPAGAEPKRSLRPGSSAMQAHVLALNRHYVPVHIFSAPRVFCLLCKGLAEVVHVEDGRFATLDFEAWREHSQLKLELGLREAHEDWVQAVQFEIEVPRVIRLLKYERVPRSTVKYNRRNVFLRDEHRCQYCARRFSVQRLSLDHVMPRSRGGPDTWENVVCACLNCNVRKGGRTPLEAGMRLLSEPVRPKRSPLVSRQLMLRKYSAWKAFISAVPDGAF